jgi:hypothetical protein
LLIEKVNWLRAKRIPNIQRERIRVDWLHNTNIKLDKFIRDSLFEDVYIWKFEDECNYIHLELVDNPNVEAKYWQDKVAKRE